MSIFKPILSVLGKVPGIVTFIVKLAKQIAPFIQAAREVSPDLEEIVTKIETEVQEGGEAADQYLDAKIDVIRDLDGFFRELKEVGEAGESVTSYAITATQVETPTELTPAELEELVGRLGVLKDRLRNLGTKTELEAKLAALD